MKKRVLGIFGVWIAASSLSYAQFHTKEETASGGSAAINPQAVAMSQKQAASLQASLAEAGANYSGGDVVLSEGQKQALAKWNPRLGQMQGKKVEVWARRIEHSDGTFTESTEDENSNSLEQVTKSANGTVLQTRLVRLDRYGRPAEVLIRDGRGKFKYRGLQIYDQLGRFSEEQLFDAEGTLIRRKVQEYTREGFQKPLRSWNYVSNVPEDLKLVVTRVSEDPTAGGPAQAQPEKRGLFGKVQGGANKANHSAAATIQAQPTPTQQAEEPKRKGLSLGRLFGGSKRNN
jgi:hypothetical protein